jgi:hypothetical protein
MEIKKIETYSLYEFCQVVQQSIIDGWRFDFESNDLFPTAFGSMLVTGMVKAQPTTNDLTEDNAEVKRGRKPKQ